MKTLIAYYSRTGTTKKVAEKIKELLDCDIEEIIDTKKRDGPVGYIMAGKEASTKKLATIKPIEKNPADYDLIIVGTPVWAFTMAPAIRTYLTTNEFKKVAFFCTENSSGDERTFKAMEELSSKPIATMVLLAKEVAKGEFEKKVRSFIEKLA